MCHLGDILDVVVLLVFAVNREKGMADTSELRRKPADVCEVEVEGIGYLLNRVEQELPATGT